MPLPRDRHMLHRQDEECGGLTGCQIHLQYYQSAEYCIALLSDWNAASRDGFRRSIADFGGDGLDRGV